VGRTSSCVREFVSLSVSVRALKGKRLELAAQTLTVYGRPYIRTLYWGPDHGRVLYRRRSDTLRTSDFMDDVMFAHNTWNRRREKAHTQCDTATHTQTDSPGGSTGPGRSLPPTIVWLVVCRVYSTSCRPILRTVKGKGSPCSITERRVPELIPVLGSQPAGDMSHKPGGRLPLLSTRPAVTPATLKRAAISFAAWWTEAQWVWTVCLKLLPDSVATAIWTRALRADWPHISTAN